jgi:hypothetical protein
MRVAEGLLLARLCPSAFDRFPPLGGSTYERDRHPCLSQSVRQRPDDGWYGTDRDTEGSDAEARLER